MTYRRASGSRFSRDEGRAVRDRRLSRTLLPRQRTDRRSMSTDLTPERLHGLEDLMLFESLPPFVEHSKSTLTRRLPGCTSSTGDSGTVPDGELGRDAEGDVRSWRIFRELRRRWRRCSGVN